MVSTFKLAVFMVNVIIAFTLPIVALVKVRRKESVMKFIIIGVVTSFLVTFLQNILLILGAGMFPDLYKQGNTYILTSLLVITQFLALFIVINLLKGKFFKQKMDQQMGLAMTLGYLLNFTFGQVMSHFNYFLAGFAINMGQLSEIFNQEQILYYTTNVVDRSELYYFANIFSVNEKY